LLRLLICERQNVTTKKFVASLINPIKVAKRPSKPQMIKGLNNM
jgi:hypothetical protein